MIQESFADLLDHVPGSVKENVRSLPYDLGVSKSSPGCWEDYVQNEVFDDIPTFFGEGTGIEVWCRFKSFRRVYHWIGMYGLSLDRIIDKDFMNHKPNNEVLNSIQKLILQETKQVFQFEVRAYFKKYVAYLIRGVQYERNVRCKNGKKEFNEYIESVLLKTTWMFSLMNLYYTFYVSTKEKQAYNHVFQIFIIALQLGDDACDVHEDRERKGQSIIDNFELSAEDFLQVSSLLIRHLVKRCEKQEMVKLMKWCEGKLDYLNQNLSGAPRVEKHKLITTMIVEMVHSGKYDYLFT